MSKRDPSVDHPHELYPEVVQHEDLSDVLVTTGQGANRRVEQVVGENVDDDGVAHFLRISPDPDVPDLCGGCEREWPCDRRVPLQVVEQPRLDPMLVAAVAEAVRRDIAEGRVAP